MEAVRKKNSQGRESQNPPTLLVVTPVVSGGKWSSSSYSWPWWPWNFGEDQGIRVLEDEDPGIRKEEIEKKWMRAFSGFDKNQIGKGVLVGPGSRACHVLLYSVYFNSILVLGVTVVQLD